MFTPAKIHTLPTTSDQASRAPFTQYVQLFDAEYVDDVKYMYTQSAVRTTQASMVVRPPLVASGWSDAVGLAMIGAILIVLTAVGAIVAVGTKVRTATAAVAVAAISSALVPAGPIFREYDNL